MITSCSDPFEALFALQRALEANIVSDWMGQGTTGTGSYLPINIFKQGDDFVAVTSFRTKSIRAKNQVELDNNEGKPIAFLGIEQGTSCDLLARDSH